MLPIAALLLLRTLQPFDSCGVAHVGKRALEAAAETLPEAFPWSVTVQCKCLNEHYRRIPVRCHGNLIENEPGTGRSDVILTTASCLLKHSSCRRCEVIRKSANSTLPVSIMLANLEFQKNRLSRNVALLFTSDYITFNNKSSPVCMEGNMTEGETKKRCLVTSTASNPDGYPAYIQEVSGYTERLCNRSANDVCTEIPFLLPQDVIQEGFTMLCLHKNHWFLHAIGEGKLIGNRTVLDNVANSKSWIETKVAHIRSNVPAITLPKPGRRSKSVR